MVACEVFSEHHLNASGLNQSGLLKQLCIQEVCSIDDDDLSCKFRSLSKEMQQSLYAEELSKRMKAQ